MVDVAVTEAEARLVGYRRDLEELEAEGRDATRVRDLMRTAERQIGLLHERRRLLRPEPNLEAGGPLQAGAERGARLRPDDRPDHQGLTPPRPRGPA